MTNMEPIDVNLLMEVPGLDREAIEALLAEQQIHLTNLTRIGQKNPGTWPYVINDEADRHSRNLEEIIIGAQKRTQQRSQRPA